jgi:hypothetical protein
MKTAMDLLKDLRHMYNQLSPLRELVSSGGVDGVGDVSESVWAAPSLIEVLLLSVHMLAMEDGEQIRHLRKRGLPVFNREVDSDVDSPASDDFPVQNLMGQASFLLCASIGPEVARYYTRVLIRAAFPGESVDLIEFSRKLVCLYARQPGFETPFQPDPFEWRKTVKRAWRNQCDYESEMRADLDNDEDDES